MQPQERKNLAVDNILSPLGNPRALWFGVVLLALPALCLLSLGWMGNSTALIVGGVLMLIVPAAMLLLAPRIAARESTLSAYAQAEVIDRQREKSKTRWSGQWLDLIYALYLLFDPPHDHHVVLSFDAIAPGGSQQPVLVKAQVTKTLYEQLAPGSSVLVQYAPNDPLRVRVEGEHRWRDPSGTPPS